MTALINFHKAQCYLAGAFQINALILVSKTIHGIQTSPTSLSGPFPDFFDTSVLISLATSGLVPITFSLVLIQRFGKQTWYILILSSITSILVFATFALAIFIDNKYAKPWHFYDSLGNTNFPRPTASCAIPGKVGDSVFPLCGSRNLDNNALDLGEISNSLIWLVWAKCMVLVITCLGHQLLDKTNRGRRFKIRWHAKHSRKIADTTILHWPWHLMLALRLVQAFSTPIYIV